MSAFSYRPARRAQRRRRENHHVSLEVGTSKQPMPVHFHFPKTNALKRRLVAERRLLMRDLFDLPDLYAMDDGIAN